MIKLRAFSLIELMVVIAIVAILAAVALPAYQQYVVKGKVSQARNYMDAVLADAKQFYTSKGRFPVNVTELKLPSAGDGTITTVPTGIDSYLLPPNLGMVTVQAYSVSNCNAFNLTGILSNFSRGDYWSASGSSTFMSITLVDVDGIIYQHCHYTPGQDAQANISGCSREGYDLDEIAEWNDFLTTNCS